MIRYLICRLEVRPLQFWSPDGWVIDPSRAAVYLTLDEATRQMRWFGRHGGNTMPYTQVCVWLADGSLRPL